MCDALRTPGGGGEPNNSRRRQEAGGGRRRREAAGGRAPDLSDPDRLAWLSRLVPVVTVAATATPTTVTVGSDNRAGMRALVRCLLYGHGYRSLGT